jgi:hypothetical protein
VTGGGPPGIPGGGMPGRCMKPGGRGPVGGGPLVGGIPVDEKNTNLDDPTNFLLVWTYYRSYRSRTGCKWIHYSTTSTLVMKVNSMTRGTLNGYWIVGSSGVRTIRPIWWFQLLLISSSIS